MNAVHVLDELSAAGIQCELRGQDIALKGSLNPELVEKARAVKPELLRWLKLGNKAAIACEGLSAYIRPEELLAKLTPEDLAELASCPEPLPFLRSFAIALVWTDFRRQGIAPPTWDQAAHCDKCGPVFLWAPLKVAGCPWCWNRLHGVKIPRPAS